MKSPHGKCVGAAVALLLIMLAGTTWLGYGTPSVVEAYGFAPEAFRFNWLIVPIVFLILGSILVAVRTNVLSEQQRCYWIVGMVLLFPFSTAALPVRIFWRKP
jgi:hypothetical protein